MTERPDPLNDCPDCWEHYCDYPILDDAFATIAMESYISVDEIASVYFGLFHEQGHRMNPPSKKKGRL